MPTRYSAEEKKLYFETIRKNDPTRLCERCNRLAVHHFTSENRHTCNFHAQGIGNIPTRLGPKESIDSLVALVQELLPKLDKTHQSDMTSKAFKLLIQIRPNILHED